MSAELAVVDGSITTPNVAHVQTAPLFSFSEIEQMARAIYASQMFGMKTPEQALALMLIAQSEGLHPATAARDYHIINNRASMKADAMLARFQAAGGRVAWGEYTETRVEGTFFHPAGGELTVAWTIDMAKRAKLTGKDVWTSFPRGMLRARVISEAVRTIYPGVLVGMYTPDEVEDFEPIPPRSAQRPSPKQVAAPEPVARIEPAQAQAWEPEKPQWSEADLKTIRTAKQAITDKATGCGITIDPESKQLTNLASWAHRTKHKKAMPVSAQGYADAAKAFVELLPQVYAAIESGEDTPESDSLPKFAWDQISADVDSRDARAFGKNQPAAPVASEPAEELDDPFADYSEPKVARPAPTSPRMEHVKNPEGLL